MPPALEGWVLPPFVEYRHVRGRCNSITGGYVYRGSKLTSLRGRYVCGIWSVAVGGAVARDRRAEPLLPPGLLVLFGEGSQGELYVVALNGRVYRVE